MLDTHRDSTDLLSEVRQQRRASRSLRAPRRRPEELLKRLEVALPLAGISRVADISWLSPAGIQVRQVIRPDTYSHVFFGQNSGSQGKGRNETTARISAIMEALESFSAEPRNAQLVRGTYNFLRRTHPIICPADYLPGANRNAFANEPLMWTSALLLREETEVLVPAEAAFFPFFPAGYATATVFASHSTGIAAGVSRLEAALHGIYEVIERHYRAALERRSSRLVIERIQTADAAQLPCVAALRKYHPDVEVYIFAVRFRGASPGPTMIQCVLRGAEGGGYAGFSCNSQPLMALEAAVIEAQQSAVTIWSGSREDTSIQKLGNERTTAISRGRARVPSREMLSVGDLMSREVRQFRTPNEELNHVIEWVRSLGFAHVLVKDLTRVGLDIPVVRVLIPGTHHSGSLPMHSSTLEEVMMCRFSTDLGADHATSVASGKR